MPTYTNAPPPDPRGQSLELMRTPGGKPLVAIVTSSDLIGCPTHFYGGRTIPCEGENCEPHRKGIPWRWHAYLGALMQGTRQHFLYEITARIAQEFVTYRERYETLRGCQFKATRPSKTPNGRVRIELYPTKLPMGELPPEPDVINALAIIWNLASPSIDASTVLRDMPRIAVVPNGNGNGQHPDPFVQD